ncbi:hypothetical protein EYF80_015135 [Liparis tanakae]|uniref:Uncharacterized protein n=1 Tax=Liparis tanakae TaxID=230148 RepID=A0A4Z2I9E1_9TELE|nr:hypothetical protein EYF80_015135 [Liparis tanakae]
MEPSAAWLTSSVSSPAFSSTGYSDVIKRGRKSRRSARAKQPMPSSWMHSCQMLPLSRWIAEVGGEEEDGVPNEDGITWREFALGSLTSPVLLKDKYITECLRNTWKPHLLVLPVCLRLLTGSNQVPVVQTGVFLHDRRRHHLQVLPAGRASPSVALQTATLCCHADAGRASDNLIEHHGSLLSVCRGLSVQIQEVVRQQISMRAEKIFPSVK